MPVELLGTAATDEASEVTPRSRPSFGKDHTLRLARAHEEHGRAPDPLRLRLRMPDPAPGPVRKRRTG
jgi:alkanesulfonate monooxygenase